MYDSKTEGKVPESKAGIDKSRQRRGKEESNIKSKSVLEA